MAKQCHKIRWRPKDSPPHFYISFRWGGATSSWGWMTAVHSKKLLLSPSGGTFLVVHWLGLCPPNTGGPGSNPGQGTRPHMLQLKKKKTLALIRKVFTFTLILFYCQYWCILFQSHFLVLCLFLEFYHLFYELYYSQYFIHLITLSLLVFQ